MTFSLGLEGQAETPQVERGGRIFQTKEDTIRGWAHLEAAPYPGTGEKESKAGTHSVELGMMGNEPEGVYAGEGI